MHYYQFNIADYRKDTQHLTPIEHYIYRELIDWYYLDESPIPKKTELVIRRLRLVSENNQELQNVLEEFFIETDDGWFHTRIDDEISKYQAKVETAKANGSKGGRPKKPKKTKPVILANQEKTGSKANQEPLTNNQEGKPAAKATCNPIGIQRFIEERKAEGEQPIQPDDPIFDYVSEAGIPLDFLRLCWVEFVERNIANNKRQKDWRKAFRNCVRGNWYKLWWLDGDTYSLTTTGKQAEMKQRNDGRAA